MAYKETVEYQKSAEKLQKTLSQAASSAEKIFSKEVLKSLEKAGTYVESLSSTLKSATEINLVDVAADLEKASSAISKSTIGLNRSLQKTMEAEKALAKAQREKAALEKKKGQRTEAENERLKEQNEIIKKQEAILKRTKALSESYAKSIEQARDTEEDALARVNKQIRLTKIEAENLSNTIEGTFLDPESAYFSGKVDKQISRMKNSLEDVSDVITTISNADFSSVVSKGSSLLESLGKRTRALGEKRRMDRANKGLGAGKLSRGLGGLGKGLMVGGAVIAGAAAVVSAIQSVEEKIKGVHKELIEAYGATDLMADSMGSVEESANKVRKELSDASFANNLGVTLEESRQLVTSLNETGLNVRTMKGDMESLKEITTGFQAASKMLGVSFSDVASYTQNFREELGVAVSDGHLLGRMADHFGQIRDMALQSSFSTNRFFQVIQGLTEGIGSMNVRVGEAGKLFISLSKVLGPKSAQQFAQGLTEGFKGEGIQDRFKRIILTGGAGKMRGVFQRTAAATEKDMLKNLSAEQQTILDKMGGMENIRNEKQLKELMRQLRNTEGGAGASQQAMRTFNLRRAAKGGMNEQALAMGDMDMSGTLSAQMAQVYAFLGKKGFEGMSAIELEALANYTGKSIDELMELKKLDFAYQADFQKAQEVLAAKKGKSDAEMMAALKKEGIENVKVVGGKLVSESGDAIDSIDSYVQAQGAVMDSLQTTQIDQLSMLGEVRNATLTSADMINNHLGGLLQDVGGHLDFLTGWMTKEDKSAAESLKKRKEIAANLADEVKGSQELNAAKKKENLETDDRERRRISGIKDIKAKIAAQKKFDEDKKKRDAELEKAEAEVDIKSRQQRVLMSSQMMGESGTTMQLEAKAKELARVQAVRTSTGRAVIDTLEGEGAGALAATAQVAGITDAHSGEQLKQKILQRGLSAEEIRSLERMGLDARYKDEVAKDEVKLGTGDRFGTQVKKGIRTLALGERLGQGGSVQADEVYETRRNVTDEKGEEMTYQRFGTVQEVKEEAATEILKSNVELSKLKELMEREHSPAKIEKLDKQAAEINAQILAKNKQYQDATGKTYTEAILAAEKKKTEAEIGSYLNQPDFAFTGNRSADLATLESLKTREGMTDDKWNELRGRVRMMQGFDMQFDPMSDRPILLRRGAAVIGQPYDTAYFKDNTVGGGGGAVASNSSNIVININGGDENRIFKVVQDALRRNREAVV